jgi:hypothetical protein
VSCHVSTRTPKAAKKMSEPATSFARERRDEFVAVRADEVAIPDGGLVVPLGEFVVAAARASATPRVSFWPLASSSFTGSK